MQPKSRIELYHDLIRFIESEARTERTKVNRKMLNVFFWCFIMPVGVAAALFVLIKAGVLPVRMRGLVEWVILLFPVSYSLYYLGSEVLAEIPQVFRRGGLATALSHSLDEGQWRHRVAQGMDSAVPASAKDWSWMTLNLRQDLASMRYRAKYLTALAGAVFFLLMEGIDFIGGKEDVDARQLTPYVVLNWVETASFQITQLVGLSLFLVLLYLSSSQLIQSIERYLNCAELICQEKTDRLLHGRRQSD